VGDAITTTNAILKDVDFGEPGTEEGETRAELAELRPSSFRDPETGEVDWLEYDSARDTLIDQMPEVWQQAYESRLRLPEDLHDIEADLKQVSQLRDELSDIPKYRGVTVEEQAEVRDFMADVERWRFEQSSETGHTPPIKRAISRYAGETGVDPELRSLVTRVRRIQSDGRLDESYIDFLVDNVKLLRQFYPSLYTQYIQQQVARRGR